MLYSIYFLISFLGVLIPLLISVAYLTLMERKIMGAIQRRQGPNIVGLFGFLQPIADGAKLFAKETIFPSSANLIIFFISPILTFFLSILSWLFIPLNITGLCLDINLGIMYLLAISSLGIYGVLSSGWSSNSKYALLGSLRSTVQLISYEISIGLILISILVCVGSLNLIHIFFFQKTQWFIVPLPGLFFLFYISILAETNRSPFDLPEGESELVAGFNVEYAAMGFALFFLGEYSNMILMCSIGTIFFFGGGFEPLSIFFFKWIPFSLWFSIKSTFLLFGFILIRASFPRQRYDQLMFLGWKIFLPLSLSFVFFIASFLLRNNSLN
uniref:NADH dehydrogenase subunit 1 n=1 Tax=Erythrolobus coxiae TaxID=362235 RepID=UPI001FCCCF70|nr:NADH dehydrogenase subunit 1 [Erythrolobus coxiae]UNJ19001.1 NADH dehydrogenase subunit 1 [Erythrolobus coxiae]